MKNYYEDIRHLILFITATIIIVALTVRCGSRPMASTKEKDIEHINESTHVNQESTVETHVNKAIIDSLIIQIARIKSSRPDCDSICQVYADHQLEQLNRVVTSGNNQYKLLWDKYTRQLSIIARLSETKSEKSERTKDSIRNFVRTRTVTIKTKTPVPYTPDLMKYSAYFGWVSALFFIGYIIKKIKSWLPKTSII